MLLNPKASPNGFAYLINGVHDIFHAITQNLHKTFSKYRKLSPELLQYTSVNSSNNNPQTSFSNKGETYFNQNNQVRFTFKNYQEIFADINSIPELKEILSKNLNKFSPKAVINNIPSEIKQMSRQDRQMALTTYLSSLTQALLDLLPKNLIPQSIFNKFNLFKSKNYFTSAKNGIKVPDTALVSQNLTHLIEEEIGNFISFTIGGNVSMSKPIIKDFSISQILMAALSAMQREEYKSELAQTTFKKWMRYYSDILSPLIEEYNKELNKLSQTKFGTEFI